MTRSCEGLDLPSFTLLCDQLKMHYQAKQAIGLTHSLLTAITGDVHANMEKHHGC